MLVYLDTCAVQRPLDDRNQLRIRVEADVVLAVIAAIEAGEVQLVSSDVLRYEIENITIPARRDFGRRVLGLTTVDTATTGEVAKLARGYVQASIKPLDALHLGSAVQVAADFFCTVDDGLLRKGRAANTRATQVDSLLELISELSS